MITTADFPGLTDDLQSLFNEVAERKVADNVGFQVFNVFDTDRRTYDHLILHGLSGIRRVTPGEDLPKINTGAGDDITFTQEYFGGIVEITKAMRKFDLYNQIETLVRSLGDDAFDKVDQSLADRLLNGWSTSYTDVFGGAVTAVGPDGLALFSAAHTNPLTGRTYSNIINDGVNPNPSFSREAVVEMRARGMAHKDPNGQLRPINYDTIIVGPALEDVADRVLNSDLVSGGNTNDRNSLKGKIRRVIVWPRLAATSGGTDTSDYWFMADSSQLPQTLMALFAERPSLDAPEQVYENKNWEYSCDFFYTIGVGYPAYIAGSKGTNS